MIRYFQRIKVDWYLILPGLILSALALFTLISFGEISTRFIKQSVWILFGFGLFVYLQKKHLYILKDRKFVMGLYILSIASLLLLFITGHVAKGAQSWIKLGFLSIQPTDPAKLALILLLSLIHI